MPTSLPERRKRSGSPSYADLTVQILAGLTLTLVVAAVLAFAEIAVAGDSELLNSISQGLSE